MASWLKSLQVISVMTNLFVVLCGVATIIAGVITLTNDRNYFSITDNPTELYRIPYSLIVLGVCVLCMALLGLVGSLTTTMIGGRILLGVYIFVLSLIVFSEIAAGGSALRAKSTNSFERTYINSSNETLKNYSNASIRKAWDSFQQKYHCCGAVNCTSYKNHSLAIPESCCRVPGSLECYDAINHNSTTNCNPNNTLYTEGCPRAVLHLLQADFEMIGAVMMILGLGQFIGVVVGCLLVIVSAKEENGKTTPYSYNKLRTVHT